MPVNSIARTVLRYQYTLVRSPLTAFDTQVLGRLPDSSRVKMALTRGLAGLDAAAGRFLNDSRLERRGDAVVERIATSERADQSRAKAEALRARAAEVTTNASSRAAQRRIDAARTERERIADALREEQQATQQVGELADADADEQARQADLRAKHQQAEQAEQRRAKQRRIEAATKQATAPAKAQLKSAAQTKATAQERRATADTLDHLAAGEKAARRTRSTS